MLHNTQDDIAFNIHKSNMVLSLKNTFENTLKKTFKISYILKKANENYMHKIK